MEHKPTVDVAKLVASGYGVSRLRSAGVSPAEIRAAGFTIEQMHEHLGVFKLKEAGFQLEDFQRANFPVNEILGEFSLEEVLNANPGAYPLETLMKCVPPNRLKNAGGFTAENFYQLGTVTAAELKHYGFGPEEIAEAVARHPAPAPVVTGWQPAHAVNMAIGEEWKKSAEGRGLTVTYMRVPVDEAETLLADPLIEKRTVTMSNQYQYGGSGRRCPRCGRLFVLTYKMASADDSHADELGKWICDDASCGMTKTEVYTGYGTVFESLC
jgi:hypothetical protein